MIKFQCDTCGYETDSCRKSKNNGEYIPLRWITLSDVTVHNEHHSSSLSYAGNATMHFCSKKCFIDKFFKPEETIKLVENTSGSSCSQLKKIINIEQEIQNILDRNFTRGDNTNALKELLVLYNAVEKSELLKAFLLVIIEEFDSGGVSWETRNSAESLLKSL